MTEKSVDCLKRLTSEMHDIIDEVAQIHEQCLSDTYLDYTYSRLSVALRKEMIEKRLKLSDDYIIYKDTPQLSFIWGHFDVATKTVKIEMLYVAKACRRTGLGRAFKEGLENYAIEKGAKAIESTVHHLNTPMIDLNEKLGYRVESVMMKKDLT